VSPVDRLTLASVSNCESADIVVRDDRWCVEMIVAIAAYRVRRGQ
jgi:hypothetical protein